MDKVNEKIVGIPINVIERGIENLLIHKNYVKDLKEALAKSVFYRIRELSLEDKDKKTEAMPELIEQGALLDDIYTFLDILDNYDTREYIDKLTGS